MLSLVELLEKGGRFEVIHQGNKTLWVTGEFSPALGKAKISTFPQVMK